MPSLIETIAATVHELATPEMKPKNLIKAVREKYPDAKKQDIVRAAFYAVISRADADPEKADRLQAMAIRERNADADDCKPATKKPPRKRKAALAKAEAKAD
ncbi:hypothetical protein Sa4125_17270 [Aureimonas sp. SA4125]|uniref:hypothetical protein n=1 Tax=Aureimonas sp. SA4125 TaxID=2826993 RepID=UPI001CC55F39|nr:hypothetical protein [Aureimonas sp. SA4125]BDA84185.1 hypothetical protein Sa4125_17270 [Aureimonas sp. SA4125]